MKSVISRSLCLAALATVCLGEAAAQAQVAAERKFRQACQQDYAAYCSGGDTDPLPFEKACLRQSYFSLSMGCKRALQKSSQDQAQAPAPAPAP